MDVRFNNMEMEIQYFNHLVHGTGDLDHVLASQLLLQCKVQTLYTEWISVEICYFQLAIVLILATRWHFTTISTRDLYNNAFRGYIGRIIMSKPITREHLAPYLFVT